MVMTRDFARLVRAVPPPAKPVNAGNADSFVAVESHFSRKLPSDYKELIGAYGTGCWKGFLWVLNPFASNPNLIEQARRQLDAERVLCEFRSSDDDFSRYVLTDLLIPWA